MQFDATHTCYDHCPFSTAGKKRVHVRNWGGGSQRSVAATRDY